MSLSHRILRSGVYRLAVALAASSLLLVTPADAVGQQGPRTVVGAPDAYPEIDADVLIVRQPGQDAILFRPGTASIDALRAALVSLRRARRERPRADRGELIPVVGFGFDEAPRPSDGRWLNRVLAALADAPTAELGSFGWGPKVLLDDEGLAPR